MSYLTEFIESYIETALWSSTDNADDSGGSPLDENYTPDDIVGRSRAETERECADFVYRNRTALRASGLTPGRAGHNFWLTRNGHGAGFWDEGLGDIGDALTKASKSFGGSDLYVGDNGQLYVS